MTNLQLNWRMLRNNCTYKAAYIYLFTLGMTSHDLQSMSELPTFSRKKGKQRASVKVVEDRPPRVLPFEIWSLVFTFLTTNDLASVARVSSTLLPICRSILYRSIVLRNRCPSLPYMLKVLKVDGLASLVRHATLFTTWYGPYPSPTTWVDFSLISQFRSLRSLTLIGSPFVHEHEQFQFLDILDRVSALKSFTYIPQSLATFPGELLHLPGLQHISWSTYQSKHYTTILSLQTI